jgi:hypothetical protein
MLYGGYAHAVPHSHDYKAAKSGWSGSWSSYDWDDDDHWGDKKKSHKYKKYGWGEDEPKKGWFAWDYDKGDHKDHGWYGKDWGKDPDCDPPMTHTPEPATLLLLGSSLITVGVAWRRGAGARQMRIEPSE